MSDVAATLAPQLAADRPLPKFACNVSRRIGTLQTHLHDQERRASRLRSLIDSLQIDLDSTRERIAALSTEIAELQRERDGAEVGRG